LISFVRGDPSGKPVEKIADYIDVDIVEGWILTKWN
jgi:hypothetical protein